jgi:hypothetical protein
MYIVNECPRTVPVATVRRQIILYADGVCCLTARMGNSRQSLQVWTSPRTARAHLLASMCQFTCRI